MLNQKLTLPKKHVCSIANSRSSRLTCVYCVYYITAVLPLETDLRVLRVLLRCCLRYHEYLGQFLVFWRVAGRRLRADFRCTRTSKPYDRNSRARSRRSAAAMSDGWGNREECLWIPVEPIQYNVCPRIVYTTWTKKKDAKFQLFKTKHILNVFFKTFFNLDQYRVCISNGLEARALQREALIC